MSTNTPFSNPYMQDYATAVARGDVANSEPFGGYGEVTTAGAAVGMQVTCDKTATIVGSWFGWIEDA